MINNQGSVEGVIKLVMEMFYKHTLNCKLNVTHVIRFP